MPDAFFAQFLSTGAGDPQLWFDTAREKLDILSDCQLGSCVASDFLRQVPGKAGTALAIRTPKVIASLRENDQSPEHEPTR